MGSVVIHDRPYDVAAAAAEFDRSTTLPGRFYHDDEVYRAEEDRAMRGRWLPLARVEQVARPGDYLTAELVGEPVVAVRDDHGVLRVLSNVCRHRAMPVAAGAGSCSTLRCPYHLWSYRLDGTLAGAPMMASVPSFDRTGVRLPEIRHEVWQGWVMVNVDGAAPALADQLTGLSAALAGWDFDDLRLVASAEYEADWNWKVTVENFSEYYHHLGLHRDSLEALVPARHGRCLDNAGQPWSSSVVRCAEEYVRLQGAPMSGLDPDLAATMQIFTVFPFLCAGAQGGSAFWLQVTPRSIDRHLVTWHVLVRPERAEAPDIREFTESSLAAIDVLQEEDGVACRGVQAGLASRFAPAGRFAELERSIWQFQRWLLATLADPGDAR